MVADNFSNIQESLTAANTDIDEVSSDLNGAVTRIQELEAQVVGGLTAEQGAQVASQLAELRGKVNLAARIIDPAVPPPEVVQ